MNMPERYQDLPITPTTTVPSTVNNTGGWRTFRPIIDMEKCICCWLCWKYCPDVSINIVDEKPVVDYDHCKGCGICANECPKKAIDMVKEETI